MESLERPPPAVIVDNPGSRWNRGRRLVRDVAAGSIVAFEAKHGSVELTKLKRADVVRYIDHRIAEGAARTTIKKELNTLSVALRHAGNRG